MSKRTYSPLRSVGVGVGLTVAGVVGTAVGGFAAVFIVILWGFELTNPIAGVIVLGFVESGYFVVGRVYVAQSRLRISFEGPGPADQRLAAIATVGAVAFAILAFALIDQTGLRLESRLAVDQSSVSPAWVLLSLLSMSIVAVSEEYLFRGVIQQRLQFGLGRQGGLIGASILFGSVHFFNFRGDLTAVLGATLVLTCIGWIIGYVYQRSDSLLAPILVHYLYNVAQIALVLAGITII